MPASTLPPRIGSPLLGFCATPATPIDLGSWSIGDPTASRLVIDAYRTSGYAIVQVPGTEPDADDLAALAAALRLGAAYTPSHYQASPHTRSGVSRLTATDDPAHPFQDRAGQNLHSDGTLKPLGQIATTVMICVRPARTGGHTLLFNAVGAFTALRDQDPDAAAQLLHHTALVRTSDLADVQGPRSTAGPAFGWDSSGELVSRYSLTSTDTYHPSEPTHQGDLDRALQFLADAAAPEGGYSCTLTLQPGQALILANDKLSHGRTEFTDAPGRPRLLLRGLYTARPNRG
jgi:alpha-ketoglutarate-dependent taurine dioxygenase